MEKSAHKSSTYVATSISFAAISVGLYYLYTNLAGKKKKSETRLSQQPPKKDLLSGNTKLQVVIELGGTNAHIALIEKEYVNGVISKITVKKRFDTDTEKPQFTIEKLMKDFQQYDLTDIGIASFGPLCLDKTDDRWGSITTTPKPDWQNFPLTQFLRNNYKVTNTYIDTDVNAAALAEFTLGKHNCRESLAYVTVGTGVGVGLIVNGHPVHGLTHPEGGHISVKILKEDEDYTGVCPYHGNCLEGLVTNNSIAKRLGVSINDLPNVGDDDPVWGRVAHYLAQLCLNITLLASPEVIVLGGGVLNQPTLLPAIHKEFRKLLNEYVKHSKLTVIENYIRRPGCGDDAGLFGAALLNEHLI